MSCANQLDLLKFVARPFYNSFPRRNFFDAGHELLVAVLQNALLRVLDKKTLSVNLF